MTFYNFGEDRRRGLVAFQFLACRHFLDGRFFGLSLGALNFFGVKFRDGVYEDRKDDLVDGSVLWHSVVDEF
jgi:hypothetical protein